MFHLIYYANDKTVSIEQKYPSYELKILAVIEMFIKFCVYLEISFILITDCDTFDFIILGI